MQAIPSPFHPEASATFLFKARDVVTGDDFKIMRCERSGICFTHPQPENLDHYYPIDYRAFHPAVEKLFRLLYYRNARGVVRRVGPRKKILEVGCGEGWMLEAFSHLGWEPVGFERTAQIAERVAERTGLQVFAGSLQAVEPKGGYDMVMLYNVLEHLPDPGQVLATCKALLRPGGKIVVTVPNFRSWQARLTRSAWFHLDVPRHLFHFSEPALRDLLAVAGFRVESVRTVSLALDLFGWVQSVQNLLLGEPNRLHGLLQAADLFRFVFTPRGFMAASLALALLAPAALLALAGRVCGRGAIMEIWASPAE